MAILLLSFIVNSMVNDFTKVKAKGVLLSKGKYILVMDEDDMYVQRDAFRCLYVESERKKNNLDFLFPLFLYYLRHNKILLNLDSLNSLNHFFW